jgi:hypothetical protein
MSQHGDLDGTQQRENCKIKNNYYPNREIFLLLDVKGVLCTFAAAHLASSARLASPHQDKARLVSRGCLLPLLLLILPRRAARSSGDEVQINGGGVDSAAAQLDSTPAEVESGAANIESVPAEIESASSGQGFPARPKFR